MHRVWSLTPPLPGRLLLLLLLSLPQTEVFLDTFYISPLIIERLLLLPPLLHWLCLCDTRRLSCITAPQGALRHRWPFVVCFSPTTASFLLLCLAFLSSAHFRSKWRLRALLNWEHLLLHKRCNITRPVKGYPAPTDSVLTLCLIVSLLPAFKGILKHVFGTVSELESNHKVVTSSWASEPNVAFSSGYLPSPAFCVLPSSLSRDLCFWQLFSGTSSNVKASFICRDLPVGGDSFH